MVALCKFRSSNPVKYAGRRVPRISSWGLGRDEDDTANRWALSAIWDCALLVEGFCGDIVVSITGGEGRLVDHICLMLILQIKSYGCPCGGWRKLASLRLPKIQ